MFSAVPDIRVRNPSAANLRFHVSHTVILAGLYFIPIAGAGLQPVPCYDVWFVTRLARRAILYTLAILP
ncbi:hypothetical protein [Pontibacter kalidii]|uniref:hypothetical protein n=1 Tax=Pontibacter kalidii TaxID=2592049 RepID=UPI002251ADBB|nr:hypothetical protein [Pontibacter kalidii]